MPSAVLCHCRRKRRCRRRRERLVVLLLCALSALAVLSAAPGPGAMAVPVPAVPLSAARVDPVPGPVPGPAPGPSFDPRSGPMPGFATGVVVARLFQEAAQATDTYEKGRRASVAQRAKAVRLDGLLAGQRRVLAAIHSDLGRVARAEYRTGGVGFSYTAQLLLADNPQELLRGRQLAWQADRAVTRLLERAQHAERTLADGERRARSAWHTLDSALVRLAAVKRGIAAKLASAQQQLQSEADRSVAAGKCAGAVRIEQPGGWDSGPSWVAPVEKYALSAGFDSVGEHWASRHTGQDFAVGIGTPVRSVGEGRVVSVSCGGAFGVEVVVGHPGGYYTQYAHLAGVTVDQGERVRAGQWVGQSGTSGNSTGPHLHFEVRLTPLLGSGVDPVRWLREHGVTL
ncbi:M23 family metallopeptidase [Streptomyces sp. NPDC057136]|uniref:M23 family metallopeptidase n=1 Tax=Streptomyces sp. NPDC057136 TaxID=3346029 RepID=UPI003641642C